MGPYPLNGKNSSATWNGAPLQTIGIGKPIIIQRKYACHYCISDSPTKRRKTERRKTEHRMTERWKTKRRMTEHRMTERWKTECRMTERRMTERRKTERRKRPNIEWLNVK